MYIFPYGTCMCEYTLQRYFKECPGMPDSACLARRLCQRVQEYDPRSYASGKHLHVKAAVWPPLLQVSYLGFQSWQARRAEQHLGCVCQEHHGELDFTISCNRTHVMYMMIPSWSSGHAQRLRGWLAIGLVVARASLRCGAPSGGRSTS